MCAVTGQARRKLHPVYSLEPHTKLSIKAYIHRVADAAHKHTLTHTHVPCKCTHPSVKYAPVAGGDTHAHPVSGLSQHTHKKGNLCQHALAARAGRVPRPTFAKPLSVQSRASPCTKKTASPELRHPYAGHIINLQPPSPTEQKAQRTYRPKTVRVSKNQTCTT